jgi:hypothetical protein
LVIENWIRTGFTRKPGSGFNEQESATPELTGISIPATIVRIEKLHAWKNVPQVPSQNVPMV